MKTSLDLADAPALGRSLRAIDPKLLKQKAGRTTAWWKGDETYLDVFVESDAKGTAWLQVTVRCYSLTWDREAKTLRTGTTDEMTAGTPYPGSKMVTHHKKVSEDVVAFVRAMLAANDDLAKLVPLTLPH